MTNREHFLNWCEGQRLTLSTRTSMWALFQEDPHYWGDKGWPYVLQVVLDLRQSGMDMHRGAQS